MSVFGINGAEFLVLLLIAAVVIGPERLPRYAEQLAALVRAARRQLASAKERVDAELGDELGDVDWASLDPRRYDPRRIVRDALLDDDGLGLGSLTGSFGAGAAGAAGAAGVARAAEGSPTGADAPQDAPAPFDDEAT